MSTDIFNTNDTQNTDSDAGTTPDGQVQSPATNDSSENTIYEQLVGEGKKFKTNEDLAKGKLESDKFIEHLQSQLDVATEELNKRANAEELFSKLSQQTQNSQQTETTSQGLSAEEVADIVRQTITSEEHQRTAAQNIAAAQAPLVAELGEAKAKEFVQTKAAELGLSVDFLAETAASSPSAFHKLVGLNPEDIGKTKSTGVDVSSAVNTSSQDFVQSGQPKAGTKAYFDNIRKTDIKQYMKPEVQKAIWEAVQNGTYNLN